MSAMLTQEDAQTARVHLVEESEAYRKYNLKFRFRLIVHFIRLCSTIITQAVSFDLPYDN